MLKKIYSGSGSGSKKRITSGRGSSSSRYTRVPSPLVPLGTPFKEEIGVGAHDMDYVEAQENYGIEEENEVDAVNLDKDNENLVLPVPQNLVKELVLHDNFLNVYQIMRCNAIFVNKYISIELEESKGVRIC